MKKPSQTKTFLIYTHTLTHTHNFIRTGLNGKPIKQIGYVFLVLASISMLLDYLNQLFKSLSFPTFCHSPHKPKIRQLIVPWMTSSWISIDERPTQVTAPTIFKSMSTRIGFLRTILSTEAVTSSKEFAIPAWLKQCWLTNIFK